MIGPLVILFGGFAFFLGYGLANNWDSWILGLLFAFLLLTLGVLFDILAGLVLSQRIHS